MAPKPKFQEAEKVLCYHGPLLYEAKCLRFEIREGRVQYLIHYNGWNKNWDEWVQESRIVKNNEAGIQKQRELLKNHGALTKKKKTAKKLEREALKQQKKKEKEKEKPAAKEKESQSTKEKAAGKEKQSSREEKKKEKEAKEKESISSQPSVGDKRKEREKEKDKEKEKKEQEKEKTSTAQLPAAATTDSTNGSNNSQTGEPKRKRARLDNSIESEESYLCKIEVKIKIPEDLKPVLVDDWDLITRQKMLVTVPCKQTVDDIIDDYIKSKNAKNSHVNKDAILETMLGCKDYFNVMLGSQLLYKFERPQYGEIVAENPDKPMSSIYGATHFLRLFVRLGAMLAYTSIDERTVHILLNHIHDFLKYMSKNGAALFKISDYEIAPPDYHRKAI